MGADTLADAAVPVTRAETTPTGTVVLEPPATARARLRVPAVPDWLARRVHLLAGSAAGLLAIRLHEAPYGRTALLGVLLWLLLSLPRTTARPFAVRLRTGHPFSTAMLAFAACAILASADLLPLRALPAALVGLTAAATTALACASLVRLLGRPLRAVVVGDEAALDTCARAWSRHPKISVVAKYAPRSTGGEGVVAVGESVATVAGSLDADAVIVAPGPRYTATDLQQLSWELESSGTTILLGGVFDRVAPHRLDAGTCAGVPVVAVGPSCRSRAASVAKGAIDRVGAGLLLVVLLPLLAAVAIAIRLDSPGPALFRQRRVGMGGRAFVMFKFRTMRAAGAVPEQLARTAGNEVLFKMRDDPRVTRLGRFLRRSSLDELPQLLNVLRGEMSLVGPGPALFEETSKYDREAWRRTAVKPGITGLWQVSGRSDLSWEDSIALDTHYVDNWRLTDDVAIALRTLGAVIGRRGAY